MTAGLESTGVDADGSYDIKTPSDLGALLTVGGEDENGDSRVLLLGISQPNSSLVLDEYSTAFALVFVTPFIVSSDAAQIGDAKARIASLTEVRKLGDAIRTGLSEGEFLDSILGRASVRDLYGAATRASFDLLATSVTASTEKQIRPEGFQGGLQVVERARPEVEVVHRVRRWLSAYVEENGVDRPIGMIEPIEIDAKGFLKEWFTSVPGQTSSELSLAEFGDPVALRFYGLGAGPAAEACSVPDPTRRAVLVPAAGTLIDAFLVPALELSLGKKLEAGDAEEGSAGKLVGDFFRTVVEKMVTGSACKLALARADWRDMADCGWDAAKSALADRVQSYPTDVLADKYRPTTPGRKPGWRRALTNALLSEGAARGGATVDGKLYDSDLIWLAALSDALGLNPVTATLKRFFVPWFAYQQILAGFDLGRAAATVAFAPPAICVEVDWDDAADASADSATPALDAGMTGDGGKDDGGAAVGSQDPPRAPRNSGDSLGDPHLRTFDGLQYDFQGAGEFTLVHDTSDGLEVQTRCEPWEGRQVSINTAVAMRIGTDRIGFYRDGKVRVNATDATLAEGKNMLAGGGSVWRAGSSFVIVWPDGSQVQLSVGRFIGVQVFLADARRGGKVTGLLGNFDGAVQGDLATRENAKLPRPVPFETMYGVYANSWRVTQATSLFDYAPGQDTGAFTNRNFPERLVSSADLTESERTAAALICNAAAVAAKWMEACLLDVGTTGDRAFADDLARAGIPVETLGLEPPRVHLPGTPAWIQQLGGTSDDRALDADVDGAGNVYIVGFTNGQFGGATGAGGRDAFLAKYNGAGEQQWVRMLGTASEDTGFDVAVESAGNVYVVGTTSGSLDGHASAGGTDVFLAKYNAAGDKQWTRQLGSSSSDQGNGVAVDGAGAAYVTGSLAAGLDGSALGAGVNADLFISKFDSGGGMLWTRLLGSTAASIGHHATGESIAAAGDGSIYAVGTTDAMVDGLSGPGVLDMVLVKYSSVGVRQWSRFFGTAGQDFGVAVAVDPTGAPTILGEVTDSVQGGFVDFMVAKFSAAGGPPLWTNRSGVPNKGDYVGAISSDRAGAFYVTGRTAGALDDNVSFGGEDIFVVKYSSGGSKEWTRQLGTTSSDWGQGLASDGAGNLFVVGNTASSLGATLNPTPGSFDVFILKYGVSDL